ncbi:hypothetical protein [Arthrobacter sp. H14]|uniref:hypothetical protein n=1 Tax=Arthrobacter sp. H14 TaxID=1312959 RepID=UPI0012DC7310|nr:hypothetical protein [Arthrobacter sp. H14]
MKDRVGGQRSGFGGRRQYLPAAIVLVGVSMFWIVGILGGLRVLHSPEPALTVLIWLYVMLAAVALSIVAAALAIIDITRRLRRHRQQEAAEQQYFQNTVLRPGPQPRMRDVAPPKEAAPRKRDSQPPARQPSVQQPKPEPSAQQVKREPSARPVRAESSVQPPRRDSYAQKDDLHSRTG